jgi:large subunit ribosomal protein L22
MTGPKTNEREGTRAFLRGAPMSAFKIRPVLDLIRGREVGLAGEILQFCERGPAEAVGKLLASAVANAVNNDQLDPEELFVSACYADESKTSRRMRPRARGRGARIRKRTAHVTIIVSRLPEDRLARLRAQRAAEQSNRRARRGGRAASAPADRSRRIAGSRAAEQAATETETAVETDVVAEPLEDAAEVETAAVEEVAVDEVAVEEATAEASEAPVAEAETANAETAETETPEAPIEAAPDETHEHGSAE